MTGPVTSSEAESSSADARESSEASDRIVAIDVQHLTHTYPKRRRRGADDSGSDQPRPALDDVSFSVEPGEIFGILGPNGGGKTTLFRILSTIMRPSHLSDDTRIHVLGHDLLTEAHKVRQSLGVVFQAPSLDGKLNARENMTHQGHLYGRSVQGNRV